MLDWTVRVFAALVGTAVVGTKRPRRAVNRAGWDAYARAWDAMKARRDIPDLPAARAADVEQLGDEWSLMGDEVFSYGVAARSAKAFGEYLDARLFAPHLGTDLRIMEIGPGGGRVTKLLLPRARVLYAVDISAAMLQRLRARFAKEPRIVPLLIDGTTIDGIAPASLDAVISFDAFVHLDPWEIYRYLEIIHRLLRPGGTGIIHFADVETPIGFELFRAQVPSVVQQGVDCATFSVMTKAIMKQFLLQLGFDIVSLSNDALRRDAVAVFRPIAQATRDA